MTPKLSDITPDLLYCILRLCSRSDLASLSRVNSSIRQAAEYTLYRYIYISLYPFDLIRDNKDWAITTGSLLRTLSSNPQKAALLRYLHVHFKHAGPYDALQAVYSILKRIVDALQNAHDLIDLRIIVGQGPDISGGMLSEVINGCVQLRTLYCEACHDLERIIISQKNLQILGIYDVSRRHRSYHAVSKLVKKICNNQVESNRKLPGIFMLRPPRDQFTYSLPLTLFPDLCLPGQAFTVCRDIATSLGQACTPHYGIGLADDHHEIAIKVFDYSQAKFPNIREMAEATAEYFSECQIFSIEIENDATEGIPTKSWRIPGLLTSINQFKQLEILGFHVYVDTDHSLHQMAMDLRSSLKELVPNCPSLYEAYIQVSSETANLRSSSSGWNVVIVRNDR